MSLSVPKIDTTPAVLVTGAVVIIGLYWLAKREVSGAIGAVGEGVNPTSDQNVFYRGLSGVGNAIAADGQDVPLGSRLYDWLEPFRAPEPVDDGEPLTIEVTKSQQDYIRRGFLEVLPDGRTRITPAGQRYIENMRRENL